MKVCRLAAQRLVALVAFGLIAASAAAQSNTGQISGTVKDASGGVLPGVTVTVTNVGTTTARAAVTDERGSYIVTNLPVGTYTVMVELQGFRKAEKTGFEVTPDGKISADFALAVGAMTETVEVQAVRGETVNRTSGELSRIIDGAQVRELALSGRNYLELASLIPGAVQIDDDQMALTTSLGTGGTIINGSRGNTNSLMVDGGFNLDSGSNASQINNVGLDFIDQVKIQTSNFSAEIGRNSGAAINVVTKSGTNSYKGSAFTLMRDEKFDAANYFAPKDANGKRIKGQLDFRDFGGALGGPIQKGKLWALSYLAEWRSGFPFPVVQETGEIVGPVDSHRYPDSFDLNLHLERRFEFHGQRFAIRVGVNNVTDSRNPAAVYNVIDSPRYLQFVGNEGRHIVVRFRFFGRGK